MAQKQKAHVKIWTATRDSQAGFMVMENKAYMVADRNNFVGVTKNGTVIAGKSIVLNVTSENIRAGGLFVKQNDIVQMVPQTLVTPMGSQTPFPPLGLMSSVMKDMGFMTALLNPPIPIPV